MWSRASEELTAVVGLTAPFKMIRKLLAIVCLLGLHFWIHDVAGRLEKPGIRCKCRKTTERPVARKLITKVEIVPSRVCPETEIIITTKTNQVVCADPKAEWLETFLPQLMERASKQQKLQNKQE